MTQKKRQWHQYIGVCGMQTAAIILTYFESEYFEYFELEN